jgi:hypothetical protein
MPTPIEWIALAVSVGFFQVTPGGYSTRIVGPFNDASVHKRDQMVYYSKAVSTMMWIAFSGTLGVATALFFNNSDNYTADIYEPFIIFSFINVGMRWLWLDSQRDFDSKNLTIASGVGLFVSTGVTLGFMLSQFENNVTACILMIIWQVMAFRVLFISYNIWEAASAMLKAGNLPLHNFNALGYKDDHHMDMFQCTNAGPEPACPPRKQREAELGCSNTTTTQLLVQNINGSRQGMRTDSSYGNKGY